MELAHHTIAKLVQIMCTVHSYGVLHRNICQGAIGMSPFGTDSSERFKVVKMGGFDFACRMDGCRPIPASLLATSNRALMAPEIEAGLAHDARADVWSLGQLAYQLLSWLPKG